MMDRPSSSVSSDKEVCARFSKAYELLKEDGHDPQAIELLQKNVLKNCTSSIVLLGDVYSQGDETERKESIKLFRKAAALGDSSGMRNLGYCYAVGINVERNKEEGARWYTESAEAGNARAMCNIGVMYDFGNGVPQDRDKAFGWYLRSAQGGCTRGMTNLGEFYLYGKGTERDLDEAERWFRESNSPRAIYHLAEIYLDEKNDTERGMTFLRLSAEAEYSKALYRYATIVEKDDPECAREMYLKAASKGNSDAKKKLEALGIPVPESRMAKKKKEKKTS